MTLFCLSALFDWRKLSRWHNALAHTAGAVALWTLLSRAAVWTDGTTAPCVVRKRPYLEVSLHVSATVEAAIVGAPNSYGQATVAKVMSATWASSTRLDVVTRVAVVMGYPEAAIGTGLRRRCDQRVVQCRLAGVMPVQSKSRHLDTAHGTVPGDVAAHALRHAAEGALDVRLATRQQRRQVQGQHSCTLPVHADVSEVDWDAGFLYKALQALHLFQGDGLCGRARRRAVEQVLSYRFWSEETPTTHGEHGAT